MPIYEAAGSLVLHFGHADIVVSTARNAEKDYEDELCFIRQAPHVIGERAEHLAGAHSDEIDCPVRFIFDNIESLEVVINQLLSLRAKMWEQRQKYPPNHS